MSNTPERAQRRARAQQLRTQLDHTRQGLQGEGERRELAIRDLLAVAGNAVALAEELLDERRAVTGNAAEAGPRPTRW